MGEEILTPGNNGRFIKTDRLVNKGPVNRPPEKKPEKAEVKVFSVAATGSADSGELFDPIRPSEIRPSEIRPEKVSAGELFEPIRPSEIRPSEIRPEKVSAGELFDPIRPSEIRPSDIHPAKGEDGELFDPIRPSEIRPAKDSADEDILARTATSEIFPSAKRPGGISAVADADLSRNPDGNTPKKTEPDDDFDDFTLSDSPSDEDGKEAARSAERERKHALGKLRPDAEATDAAGTESAAEAAEAIETADTTGLTESGNLTDGEYGETSMSHAAETPPVSDYDPMKESAAARRKNARRKILRTRVAHTQTVPLAEAPAQQKYSDRFDQSGEPENEPAKNSTADTPVEKGGVIVKPGRRFIKTGELAPLPDIVSAERELEERDKARRQQTSARRLREIAKSGGNATEPPAEDDEYASQLVIDGFVRDQEKNIVDEDEIEDRVEDARRKKAEKFMQQRPTEEDITEASEKKTAVYDDNPKRSFFEFTGSTERREAVAFFAKEKKSRFIRLSVFAVLALLLFAFSLINQVAVRVNGVHELIIFGGNTMVYSFVNLIFSLIAFVLIGQDVIAGFYSLSRKKPDIDTVVTFMWIAVILQNVALIIWSDEVASVCNPYNAVAAAATLPVLAARFFAVDKTFKGFKVFTGEGKLCAAEKIDSPETVAMLGRGILNRDSRIYCCTNIKLPRDYINLSLNDDPTVSVCGKIIPISAVAALLTGVATAISGGSVASAVSAFAAVICVTAPVSCFASQLLFLQSENRKLNLRKAVITNYNSALAFSEADAIVVDATDIYTDDNCAIHGVKPFNSMRIDDAILYAGAMFIKSGGPLGEVFSGVVKEKDSLLPEVEELLYEEKLGLSAWINNQRVLLGTRDLLENHNVSVVPQSIEDKYTHDGRLVVYLAVEGVLSALFAVSYNASKQLTDNIKYLTSHGISVLLCSNDANITDRFVESQLGLKENTIKVISPAAAAEYRRCLSKQIGVVKAGLFFGRNASIMLKTYRSAMRITGLHNYIYPLTVACVFLGAAAVAAAALLSGTVQIGAVELILIQALWFVVDHLLAKLMAKR